MAILTQYRTWTMLRMPVWIVLMERPENQRVLDSTFDFYPSEDLHLLGRD
jgi:hypothetical protein